MRKWRFRERKRLTGNRQLRCGRAGTQGRLFLSLWTHAQWDQLVPRLTKWFHAGNISSSSKTGLGKQDIEGRYECEPFIHSFIQQIFTERLPSARPYAWCLEYIKGQKGQGLGSLWRAQSSRGRRSIHQIFSFVLSHACLSLSGFLCFHSRSFGSCLELHPALHSVHSPPLQPLLPEAPLSIPEEMTGVMDGSVHRLTALVWVLAVVSDGCYYLIIDRFHYL